MNLTFKQFLIVIYWSILDTFKYNQYSYYLSIGVQPKYAFEKVQGL